MIHRDEILFKTEEFGIRNVSDVQRDYVFGWILAGIYLASELKDYLILKGGNCLRKAYFEHTRFSNDLDFATQTTVTEDFLARELNRVCDFVQENSGVIFENDRNRVQEKRRVEQLNFKKIYEARLYFKDFYGNSSSITISIRLDITELDKIHLPVQEKYIIHPYSDYEQCKAQIKCLKLEEVLASKLKCLLQRRHSYDLYDFVFSTFLNKSIEINRFEIIKTFLKMTIFEKSPGIVRGLLIDLPFEALKRFWENFIVCPRFGLIGFDVAVSHFKEHVNNMFGGLPVGSGAFAFFPSNLRNPIFEAGSSMTCLEIVYGGITRIVEPYSQVYKVRKDGVGREYLYVYDKTGGRDSGPGIKSLVHTNIESLKNTKIKFEPRFEVELSKAGEFLKNTYFGRQFGLSRRKNSVSLRSKNGLAFKTNAFELTYIFECPVCRKKFRRKTYNAQLNQHKDKYGNRCYGSSGIYLGKKY